MRLFTRTPDDGSTPGTTQVFTRDDLIPGIASNKRVFVEAIYDQTNSSAAEPRLIYIRGELTHTVEKDRRRDPARGGTPARQQPGRNVIPVRALLTPTDTFTIERTVPALAFRHLEVIYWELDEGEDPPATLPDPGAMRPSPPAPPQVTSSKLQPDETTFPSIRPPILATPELATTLRPYPADSAANEIDFGITKLETSLNEGLYYGRLPAEGRLIDPRLVRSLAHLVGAGENRSHLVRASERGEIAATKHLRNYDVISRAATATTPEVIVLSPAITRLTVTAGTSSWSIQWLNRLAYSRGDNVAAAPVRRFGNGTIVTLDQEIKVLRIQPDAASATSPATLDLLTEF